MKSLWENLRRRHVVQVGAIYLIVGWLVAQVTVVAAPALMLPDWFDTAVIFLVILGFPIALVLAWAFELTPEGIKKSSEVFAEKGNGKAAAPAPASSSKPSIAVLPFDNLSSEKEIEHLADGMSEDIITGLAANPHLAVTSRNAAFAYKGRPTDLREVGRELGTKYILEGSLRPTGEKIRITAQLIEAGTGAHVWAEKYDCPAGEIGEVQDDVIDQIVSTLDAQIFTAETQSFYRRDEADLDAPGLVTKALGFMENWSPTYERIEESLRLLKKATELDPDYGPAHALYAFWLRAKVINGAVENLEQDLATSEAHLKSALRVAPNDPLTNKWIGCAHMYGGDHPTAVQYFERSLKTFPNDATAIFHYALALGYVGRFDEAFAQFERANKVAPTGGMSIAFGWYEGIALGLAGRWAEAEELLQDFLTRANEYVGGWMFLALAQARQDKDSEARKSLKTALEIDSGVAFDRPPLFISTFPSRPEERPVADVFKDIWPAGSPETAGVSAS